MYFKLIEGPSVLPVTVDEFEEAIRQKAGQSNVTKTFSLDIATAVVEAYLGFHLLRQKWKVTFDTQPTCFKFPKILVSEISSIVTIAADGSETIESPLIYSVETGRKAAVWLNDGEHWTETERKYRKFRIGFYQGYDNVAAIPANLRNAAKAAIIDIAEGHYMGECTENGCMMEKAKKMLSMYREVFV